MICVCHQYQVIHARTPLFYYCRNRSLCTVVHYGASIELRYSKNPFFVCKRCKIYDLFKYFEYGPQHITKHSSFCRPGYFQNMQLILHWRSIMYILIFTQNILEFSVNVSFFISDSGINKFLHNIIKKRILCKISHWHNIKTMFYICDSMKLIKL